MNVAPGRSPLWSRANLRADLLPWALALVTGIDYFDNAAFSFFASYIAGGIPNSPGNMVRWLRVPHAVKPGTEMPPMGLTEQEARHIAARSVVIVGTRTGGSALFDDLQAMGQPVHLTGDANAPGAIAHAVYQGHKTARSLGTGDHPRRDAPFAPRDFEAAQ